MATPGRSSSPNGPGSFARQLSLGEGVDSENLTAGYANGVLHVTIPASPKTQARRVEVAHAAGAAASCQGAPSSRVRRPQAARAAAPAECPGTPPPEAVPAFPAPASWPRWQHIWQHRLSGKVRMPGEEDPVHAAIPPGRTAGRTAARTAVTAADPSPAGCGRQGTGGARRGTRPACRTAAPARGCGKQAFGPVQLRPHTNQRVSVGGAPGRPVQAGQVTDHDRPPPGPGVILGPYRDRMLSVHISRVAATRHGETLFQQS